jgi:hypothetical protein
MSIFVPNRRWALNAACLMTVAILLACASTVRADNITYNIVDYPANEADVYSGTTDAIAGTILTDGTIGPLSAANIVGGTLSFTYQLGTLTGAASFGNPVGLEATPTELVLGASPESSFSIIAAPAQVGYENYPGNGQYYGEVTIISPPVDYAYVLAAFDSLPVSTAPGSIGENSSWVIAAVPEPDSIVLLLSVIAGVFAALSHRFVRFFREHSMSISVPNRRWAFNAACLTIVAFLLVCASSLRADNITYNIVDYPANEALLSSNGAVIATDMISGTIITDGTIGPLSAANIIGGTFSFTDWEGDLITGPATFGTPVGLLATPTQLVLVPDGNSSFWISTSESNPPWGANAVYDNYPGSGQYYGGVYIQGLTAVMSPFESVPVTTDQGSIGASSNWVIAAVPEPSSLALLFSAFLILAFAAVYFRRRSAGTVCESNKHFVDFLRSLSHAVPKNHNLSITRVSNGSIVPKATVDFAASKARNQLQFGIRHSAVPGQPSDALVTE